MTKRMLDAARAVFGALLVLAALAAFYPGAAHADTSMALPYSSTQDSVEELDATLEKIVDHEAEKPANSKTPRSQIENAVNPSNCSTLQFANLRVESMMTAAQIDAYIDSTDSGRKGVLHGTGRFFMEAEQQYGINAAYFIAHAVVETGWGTSDLAQGYSYNGKSKVDGKKYPAGTYYNFFGIGAVDGSPVKSGREAAIKNGWNSKKETILGSAKWIAEGYVHAQEESLAQPTLYAMRWDYSRFNESGETWHQYATSLTWASVIASCMSTCYSINGLQPLKCIRTITPVYAPDLEVVLKKAKYVYNGRPRMPKVVVTYERNKLVKGVDYDVFYAGKCKKVGTHKVTVRLKNGISAVRELFFDIVPAKPSIKKVSVGFRSFTLRASKPASGTASWFQVAYKRVKHAKWHYEKFRANKALKAKFTGLNSNKYHVKVRTYKASGDKRYYSSWSAVKKVVAKV